MRRLLKFGRRPRGCTCDSRFAWVAADIDCPKHGLKASVLVDEVGGDATAGCVATDIARYRTTHDSVAADNTDPGQGRANPVAGALLSEAVTAGVGHLHDDDCWIACPHPNAPVPVVMPVQEIS